MKIKKIMLYQAIPFRGGAHKELFNSELVTGTNLFAPSGALIERGEYGYWFVKHGNECVEIGPANVAAIVYDATPVEEPKAKKVK